MATSDIGDINLEQLIASAINGDPVSLDLLRFSPWLTARLHDISQRKAHWYKLDAEEIRDAVFDTLSEKIQTIKNPNGIPLTQCLLAWCRAVAKSVCLNKLRHNDVEKNHADAVSAGNNIHGTRKTTEGASLPIRSTDSNSPEELFSKKNWPRITTGFRPMSSCS